jgi:hypothetical protein
VTEGLDLAKIPKERWAGALAMLLTERLPANVLFDIVRGGEAKFIKEGMRTDRFGLKRDHYRACFRQLHRNAKDMGFDERLLHPGV